MHTHMHRSHCEDTYPDMVCRQNYTKRALDPPYLFDLHADPGEKYNLNSKRESSKYAEILKQMITVSLRLLCKRTPAYPKFKQNPLPKHVSVVYSLYTKLVSSVHTLYP